ncbi:hypothetical protein HanPI659440_Chr06g0221771 [Helianthus annuus]|nr:hypothetical protein HanPI659440_Chr06g0221771 [Helianthus annuus]
MKRQSNSQIQIRVVNKVTILRTTVAILRTTVGNLKRVRQNRCELFTPLVCCYLFHQSLLLFGWWILLFFNPLFHLTFLSDFFISLSLPTTNFSLSRIELCLIFCFCFLLVRFESGKWEEGWLVFLVCSFLIL